MAVVVAFVLAVSLAGMSGVGRAVAQEAELPPTLPNGIAAGDVTPTSVVLWARSTALGPVDFTIESSRTDPVTSSVSAIEASRPVTVVVDGLRPGTTYSYTAITSAGDRMNGEFKTPALDGHRTLRFGVSGDGRGDWLPFQALVNAPDRNLDFFVYLGDTVYADIPSPAVAGVAYSLEEFRLKHAEVHSTRLGRNTLAELRRSTAIFATIDDHDVFNDFAGGAQASTSSRVPESAGFVNDSARYENGVQAFQEYYPLATERYGIVGGDGRMDGERCFYRMRTFGQDAALFILDGRSFRDAPIAGPDLTSPNDVMRFLEESYTPDRTLLGDAQLARLKQDLLAAKLMGITWKIVAIPQPIQQLLISSVQDRYEGFAAERADLLAFIHENEIQNVVFVAADIHGTLVNNLSYRFDPNDAPTLTSAWEVSVGSVAASGPVGPGIVVQGLRDGWVSQEEWAVYQSLPVRNDADDEVDDKDDFVKALLNNLLAEWNVPPIGLTEGVVDAQLLRGDYLATQTYGWTEFRIDRVTQGLSVTTWGIAPYSDRELAEQPDEVLSRVPKVVSRFEVLPLPEEGPSNQVFVPAVRR